MKSFFRSFFFFLGNLVIKRHYDIVFYHPSHFNRGAKGENTFFQPLYTICERNNISYIVFEEPNFEKKTFRNKANIPFDFPLFIILILRKCISLKNFDTFEHREWYIAKLLKIFIFARFSFNNYVTISNSLLAIFRGLNTNAKLYDYQHGVIFSDHNGYITAQHKPPSHISINNANLFLYGEGFQKLLMNLDHTKYYVNHTFALGYSQFSQTKKAQKHNSQNNILFSLQFTGGDEFPDNQSDWLNLIYNLFSKHENIFKKYRIKFLLKHHPRYNGKPDVSVLEKFDFVEFFDGTIDKGLQKSFLHMTFYSTSVFDASAYGIPTILWQHDYSLAYKFTEDLSFPLGLTYNEEICEKIVSYCVDSNKYENDSNKVKQWYRYYYKPLDENLFCSLMSSKKEKCEA